MELQKTNQIGLVRETEGLVLKGLVWPATSGNCPSWYLCVLSEMDKYMIKIKRY